MILTITNIIPDYRKNEERTDKQCQRSRWCVLHPISQRKTPDRIQQLLVLQAFCQERHIKMDLFYPLVQMLQGRGQD